MVVPFAMLLNLAAVSAAEDKDKLWGFIRRYAPDATPQTHPQLDEAAGFAVRYFNDFVKPTRVFRAPTDQERAALTDLVAALKDEQVALAAIARKNADAGNPDEPLPVVDWHDDEFLQSIVFAIGKNHGFDPLRAWFSCLYEVLLGASQGPRFGGFIALYGIDETIALIEEGLSGALAS
jgi:lysyl-tRNA synthetase class 1